MSGLLVRALLVQFLVSSLAAGGLAAAVGTRAALQFDVGGDVELTGKLRGPLSSALRKSNLDIASGGNRRTQPVDLKVTCRVQRSGYRLDVVVVDARSRAVVARRSKVGDPEEIFDLIDALGRSVADAADATTGLYGTVAVLDFLNEAGDDSGALTGAIPEMLMTVLRQSSDLTLLDRPESGERIGALEPVISSRMSIADAAELGRWLGADLAVMGTLTDLLHVEIEAVSSEGERLESVSRVGLRTSVVELATAVAADLPLVLDPRAAGWAVAVLPFENHAENDFDPLVRGLPDMLMTTLGEAAELTVIERVQIDKALRNFNLEMSGPIDSDTAVEVGAWLGADAVILGSFLRFGGVFRFDARMIDAQTGEVMVAQSARGGESEVLAVVDSLGHQLQRRFDEREGGKNEEMGTLRVLVRIVKSEMGERPLYHHICKLFVDGDFAGLSPVVGNVDEWTSLFEKRVRAGPHRLEVVHGYVRDEGWDGQMPQQPRRFVPVVEPGAVTTVKYTFEVGWFSDQYVYEP